MGIFDAFISKNHEADMIVPLTKNVSNYIYFDPNTNELDMFKDVSRFVAKEFTKVKATVTDGTPNRGQINYLLNLNPNPTQTANQMLFEFAYGLLRSGKVYYKLVADKMPNALYISRVPKQGYKEFTSTQLQMRVPSSIIEQYSTLVTSLSTQHTSNVMEIQSRIKVSDTDDADTEMDHKINNRLQRIMNNIKKFGTFFTNPNETTKDHPNMTNPDGTALEDLRTLIYEQLHISPKMLDGSYNESDYRAFYATLLQPISAALEELLNSVLLTREQYINGSRIEIILDLLQFATLESFTKMAKEGIYSGYLTLDDIRHSLGKESYPDGLGQIIFSNKNAVALNNQDINNLLSTGGTANEETSNTSSDSEDQGQ